MKIENAEFISQVKEELLCFEDMEESACQWEEGFRQWLKTPKAKKEIVNVKGKPCINIKDEEEIFESADSYIEAIECNSVDKYWKEF